MNKIFDKKGRWRNVVVAFRMSEAESDDLNYRVKLSGLSKQDCLINRALERDVVINGNPRVYKALRNQIENIIFELKRLMNINEINIDLFTIIKDVSIILEEIKEEKNA